MKNYKDYIISRGGKEIGILWSDVKEYLLTPAKYEKFLEFMKGQTCGMLGSNGDYVSIVYVCDYLNFINGKPSAD